MGWMEVQRGRDTYVHMTDSLHCTVETETTLENNYTLILEQNKKPSWRTFTTVISFHFFHA